ncbi:unnamed protein product [Cyclocybe aegerita]|uniref:Uncharacterized protein n=1 Tax=Cyclocybe aegerita TaxID=1973307 RepID=A0A8S0WK10_CYCAE|nr:unnamed protein product [Cyclocybe aegerita]
MLRSPSRSSSTPGTTASPKKHRLGMAGVANLFIRMRRLEDRSKTSSAKRNHIVVDSGEPQTHPTIANNVKEEQQIAVEFTENYVCAGGVNVATLVRATRSELLGRVEGLGANTLADEQWACTISGPKPAPNGTYKVQVRYTAAATKSVARDPCRPVAMDKAKGIPGLMTIVRRNDH